MVSSAWAGGGSSARAALDSSVDAIAAETPSNILSDDGLVFVNEKDQQVYTQPLDDSLPRALTQDASCRYGDVQWHDGQVLAVDLFGLQLQGQQGEQVIGLPRSTRVLLNAEEAA